MIQAKTALNAVAATTTSDPIAIDGANRITLALTRTNHTSGSSAFAVSVSVDGTTYVTYNKLIDNVANTNAQTLTRVASKSLGSDTTALLSMDLQHDVYRFMKVTCTITTDGKGTAKCLIEF